MYNLYYVELVSLYSCFVEYIHRYVLRKENSFWVWVSVWWKFCSHKQSILPVWGLIPSSVRRKKYRHTVFYIATLPPCIFYSILSLPITTSLLVWIVYRMAYQLNRCCLFSHFPSPSLQFSILLPHFKKNNNPIEGCYFSTYKTLRCVPIVYWIKSKLTEVS